MGGTEGALIKELSWSKLISNGMDGNRLRVFARPEFRKNVPAGGSIQAPSYPSPAQATISSR